MKLITWNCQGAFRKKANSILIQQPDILVIQECEHPDKIFLDSSIRRPTDLYWYGDSLHKGISVFSFSDYKIELLSEFNPEYRYILPFNITGQGLSFNLFSIWAMPNYENYNARYIGQIWFAINHYSKLLSKSTILVGDFNSNKIWDEKERVGNHSDVVQFLADNDIHSIYHKHFGIEQGKEKHPTFFLQRNINKPYHIDYCFASTDIVNKVQSFEIGAFENWKEISDHSPLTINFDL